MSAYPLLLKLSGLSQREAADFHGVRLDTAKRWAQGHDDAPAGVIEELRALIRRQELTAQEALALYREQTAERGKPEDITVGWKRGGWPCRSAAEMMLARVAAQVSVPVALMDD